LGELVKYKTSKSILLPKSPPRSDMSGPLPYPGLTQPIQLPGRVLEAFLGHVRLPARICLTQPDSLMTKSLDWTYLVPLSGSREVDQTCLAHNPDMSTLSALSRVKAQNRTCPVPRPSSREVGRTCPASDPDMSGSLTHQRLDSPRDYKKSPTPL
jgi:hypothetical protein